MRWARCASFYSSRTRMQPRNRLRRKENHPQMTPITTTTALRDRTVASTLAKISILDRA